MSRDIVHLISKRQFDTAAEKAVALNLADRADDNGAGMWPSIPRVAAETGLDIRTVRRTFRKFEGDGVWKNKQERAIMKCVSHGGKGQGSTSRYDFVLEELFSLPLEEFFENSLMQKEAAKVEREIAIESHLCSELSENKGAHGPP